MTTWAQVIGGVVHNPVTDDPANCFTAEWLAANPPFIEVPDGTLHGATDNGNGTYTNPVVVTPDPPPKALTKPEFEELLADNGGVLQDALDNWPT